MMKYWVLVLFVLQAIILKAQEVPAFRHVRLDPSNGLRHAENNVFLGSDDKGYLWIGSDGGAYRFDGQKLTRFYVDDPQFSDAVRSEFLKGSDGSLWYGTPSGLVRFDDKVGKLNQFPLEDSLSAQFGFHLIGRDRNDQFWLASNGSHLFALDEGSGFKPRQLGSSKGVRHLMLATNDSLLGICFPWLLQQGVERVVQENGVGEITISNSLDSVIQEAIVSNGVLLDENTAWLTSDKGLLGYDVSKDSCFAIKVPPGTINSNVWDVVAFDSLLLVATEDDGLWWFNPHRQKFWRKLKSSKTGLTDKPRALHVSEAGQVLVSRKEGGVDILVPQRFSVSPLLELSLFDKQAPKILKDKGGVNWILTSTGKLYCFQEGQLDFTTTLGPDSTTNASYLMALDVDSDQFVIASNRVVQYIDRRNGKKIGRSVLLPANALRLFIVDGSFLVETEIGLFIIEREQIIPLNFQRLSSASLTDFYSIAGGKVAFYSGDTKVFIAAFEDNRLTVTDSLSVAGELLSLSQNVDRPDRLYLGTSEGLLTATQNSSDNWELDSFLLTNVPVRQIFTSASHGVWVATDFGLGLQDENGWSWITREHGLYADQVLKNGLALTDDSRILVSSDQGVAIIEDSGFEIRSQGEINLETFWINGNLTSSEEVQGNTPLALQQQNQNLQFLFSTVGIYDVEPARISYSTSGLNGDWRALGEDRMLRLSPLPVGEHTLYVKAQSADLSTSEVLQISLNIELPYWERWWFKLLVLTALPFLVGLVSFVVYRRKLKATKQAHERQMLLTSERDRIARDLHDDLGTDLSTILFLADDDGLSNESDRAEVVRLSGTALNKMREIVWTLSDQAFDNQNLIADLVEHARTQCKHRKIRFITNGDAAHTLNTSQLSQRDGRELLLLMREAIENAIRHGKPTEIQLLISNEQDHSFTIELIDNGSGFDLSSRSKGLGLSSLRRRAESLNANLEIYSTPGEGTSIKLSTGEPNL